MHGPSGAVCPSKASLHSDFSSDSFNPLHRRPREKQKKKFQSGTYWKNILYDRDNTVLTVRSLSKTALASKSFSFLWSSWRTPLLTDVSHLLIEHLAAHLFTMLTGKAPEAVISPRASENRAIDLIYMIWAMTFLPKWVQTNGSS